MDTMPRMRNDGTPIPFPNQQLTESQVRSALRHLVDSHYSKDFEPKRCEKAVQIILAREIHKLPSGNYAVKSHCYRQPVEYAVNPHYEECSCPDFRNGHICKHWTAYEILRVLEQETSQQIDLQKFATLDDLIEWCTN